MNVFSYPVNYVNLFYVATYSKIQQDFSLNVAPCSRRGQEDFRREIMAKLVILYAVVIVYSVRI